MAKKLAAQDPGAELAPTPAPAPEPPTGNKDTLTTFVETGVVGLIDRTKAYTAKVVQGVMLMGKIVTWTVIVVLLYSALVGVHIVTSDDFIMAVAVALGPIAVLYGLAKFLSRLDPLLGWFGRLFLGLLVMAMIVLGTLGVLSRFAGGPTIDPLAIATGLAGRVNQYDADRQQSKIDELEATVKQVAYDRDQARSDRDYYERKLTAVEQNPIVKYVDEGPVGMVCMDRDWLQSGCTYLWPGNEKWPTILPLREKRGFSGNMPGWVWAAHGWGVVGECEDGSGQECWRVQQGERALGGPNDRPSMSVRLKPLNP